MKTLSQRHKKRCHLWMIAAALVTVIGTEIMVYGLQTDDVRPVIYGIGLAAIGVATFFGKFLSRNYFD
jgi:preprotein translocase subunit SecY|tara:strand:+ start:809 stop:1012 length:204 start_codon:yes stop_codon:yes gene_type:complete